MDIALASYQSGIVQSGKTDSEPSGITADNSATATFSGYSLSGLNPSSKRKRAGVWGDYDNRRKKRHVSKQKWMAVRKRKIAPGKPIVYAPVTKKSTGRYRDRLIIENHFAALRALTPPFQHFPKSLSILPLAEQLAVNTVHWLQLTNQPYADRDIVMASYYAPGVCNDAGQLASAQTAKKRVGIFYSEDYQVHELPGLSKSTFLRVHSITDYFDPEYNASFVAMGNGHTPSEYLTAFFHGPTIADCATTMLACQYRAIETIIGTDDFNRLFGSPVSTFRIACSLFSGSGTTAKHLPAEFGDIKPIEMTNPLYCLFDDLFYKKQLSFDSASRKLSESDIKKGDILYIQGVDSYCAKHKSGEAMGFNLICTGQNSSGHNLYLGFDPDNFDEPKTYDQVKNILIDGYNKPQSPETIGAIKRGETGYGQLTGHILSHDHPIVGITGALRFNPLRWKYYTSQHDQAWHQQPPLTVTPGRKPKPVDQGSSFPTENLDADFDRFEPASPQQELMKLKALAFTHAVIDNLDKGRPMGLFLSGAPGIGKTHLCVAVAKKAADYGVNTLYMDAYKAGDLFQDLAGDAARWSGKIDEMLVGKDLVVIDHASGEFRCTRKILSETMKLVMTGNRAIMVSSNERLPVKAATPGIIDPLDRNAHHFFYLGDLQGDSCRHQWWLRPEVKAKGSLSRLGQYRGCQAAAVITRHAVSIDDITRKLGIPANQVRQVGHYYLPESRRLSPDYFFNDLSKTEHQAVFLECDMTGKESRYFCPKIEQFLNVVQRVHDEGLKLVVKTNKRSLFFKKVLKLINEENSLKDSKFRIIDRLKHMFPDFPGS
ncbi:ATP-binding protein [Endozoicomonas sp. SESOKO1]|uniref:ATP-binding protein n=1 Tax=Endozoicomonas sp. SESOKO1 TaxID=2828742 RepID=UPI002147883B